ncbi:HAD family phosphatase [Actinomyces viscosus]|uniref:Pyridoxal phosphate (PLP) phosphatase n=1 Tax=Actinomyces viscosus TaxID=1656 RepID=A0A448PNX9_ACTVI|nr:HAD hydrolase family protein [Actinomyces viscosus]TFH53287.1 HAD family phosphatase [Actinomyces viscosus]VEI18105.1 pyridoxal phosphate (PLP) phosphatase [Actinomyces viscosus]
MPRRLISTDLDGTIVFNGTIPLRDREAMARWREAGNLLVINTGRSVSALEHVVVPVGLEFDNAILYTGAAIVDEDIRVRHSTALPPGVVEDILDFVEGAPGVTVFTTGLDEDLLIYDTIGTGSELLTLFRPATRRDLDGREIIGVPMRFTDPETASRTETYLRRRWDGQAVGFRNQDFIDVVPAAASKGAGLRRLVADLGEPPAPSGDSGDGDPADSAEAAPAPAEASVEPIETWSIGDSWNDISMHQAADHAYALPWSPPEVVAQCDGTVSSLADLIDSILGRPTA